VAHHHYVGVARHPMYAPLVGFLFIAAFLVVFSAASRSHISCSPVCLDNLEFVWRTVNKIPAMDPGNTIYENYLCSKILKHVYVK
jgi:hypothetical protein